MNLCRLGLGALLTILVWPPAFTLSVDSLEAEGVSTLSGHQHIRDFPFQLDPHYDPQSTFRWEDIPESDDDPPFGILPRGEWKKSSSVTALAAGRGREEGVGVGVQNSEKKPVGGAISARWGRVRRVFDEMWGNVGVYLKLRGLVRWLYTEEHRWHQWSDKNFWPAPESHLFSGRRAQLRVEGAGGQGGDKQLSERWTGDVRNFLADRKLGRAEVSGTQLPLEVTTLETDIEKQSLAVIELGDLVCPHSECPRFAGCPQIFSSRFRACANTMFSQTVMDIAKDPENCPDNRVDKRVWDSVVHNPLCTHKGDSNPTRGLLGADFGIGECVHLVVGSNV